jgi:hypothetical protein
LLYKQSAGSFYIQKNGYSPARGRAFAVQPGNPISSIRCTLAGVKKEGRMADGCELRRLAVLVAGNAPLCGTIERVSCDLQ